MATVAMIPAQAAELPPMEGRTNLAAGKTVQFAPAPNYSLTSREGTDATDLTDGKLTQREDREIWREALAVGWRYPGRVNLALDLGQMSRIDEVAIRLCGRPDAGISIPGWMEVLVSDDGEHYRKVAEFSRYKETNAFEQYDVPLANDEPWIHCIRFEELEAHGRYVALRMYGSAKSVSDELYVFGEPVGEEAPASTDATGTATGFTVTHPQPYFHKPRLMLTTNMASPLPIGLIAPSNVQGSGPVTLTLDVPAGVEVRAGKVGDTAAADAETAPLPDGGRRYRFTANSPSTNKVFGRLYVQAPEWQDGQTGVLNYRFSHGDWQSPALSVPLHARTVPEAPRLETIMVGMGWWRAAATAQWPDVLDAWERLGFNSFSVFPLWMPEGDDPLWNLVEQARQRDFMIVAIDHGIRRIERYHDDEPEIHCQFEDGSVSRALCPSYRGQYYQEAMRDFGEEFAPVRPDHVSLDIELWGWRGPIADSKRCARCQASFEESGLDSWDQWLAAQGNEMWRALIAAARDAGAGDFQVGGYDFRPGHVYQKVWSFDQLYPDDMQVSQVSTYSPLFPNHLVQIGNEVRRSRSQLPASDSMPWITPGDAGTFPGEAFQWALLEAYANGARGVYFWSNRVWDAENLIAYNDVVRAIAPVEQVIVEGDLVGTAASVAGGGRISGMRRNAQMMLLVADYFNDTDGTVELRLDVPERSAVVDLLTNETVVPQLDAGQQALTVDLEGEAARLLHLRPLQ